MTVEGTAEAAGVASSTRHTPAAAVVHPGGARSRGYHRAAGTPAGDALARARSKVEGGGGYPQAPKTRSPRAPGASRRCTYLSKNGKGESSLCVQPPFVRFLRNLYWFNYSSKNVRILFCITYDTKRPFCLLVSKCGPKC